MVEFFAGKGNLTRCMRLSEIPTLSLDIKYNPETCRSPPHKSNAFDVNSVSGFPCFGCKSICVFWLITYIKGNM